jgi:ankyrin repeat protein
LLCTACCEDDQKRVLELLSLPTTFDQSDASLALKYVVRAGNQRLLEKLLADDRFDPSADPELLADCGEDEDEIFNRLLQEPRVTTEQVSQALIRACYTNSEDTALLLLRDPRADPNFDDADALVGACLSGSYRLVKKLLEAGADPSSRNNACIKLACASGNSELVELLVEDTRVDARDSGSFAVKYSWSSSIVKLLISKDKIRVTDVDREGKTLLHHVCIQGNWDVAKYLINEKGFDPFKHDGTRTSAIDFAFEGDFDEIDIELFLAECVLWSRLRWIWMKIYEDLIVTGGTWCDIVSLTTEDNKVEINYKVGEDVGIPSGEDDVTMGDGHDQTNRYFLEGQDNVRLNIDVCRVIGHFLNLLLMQEASEKSAINRHIPRAHDSLEEEEFP